MAVPVGTPDADVERLALAVPKVVTTIGARKARKVTVVPSRLVDIVAG